MAGWRLALRIARREAWKAKVRSLLVLVLVALPVVAVTAAAVVVATSQVSGVESLERRLGSAEARVTLTEGTGRVLQDVDPDTGGLVTEGAVGSRRTTATDVADLLGGATLVPFRTGEVRLSSDDGVATAQGTEVDLQDPVTGGLFELTSGRWPAEVGEVVVNRALLDEGYAVGDTLGLDGDGDGDTAPRIVGVAESAELRSSPAVAGPVGTLGIDTVGSRTWLVGGDPVSWDDLRALNERGAVVLSRDVVSDPPPASAIPEELGSSSSDGAATAVLALVVAMVVLEVVLLAGPAFAVGARRQARTLALLASTGATPAQARRTVLASAVVLGGVAALSGVVLGLGAAVVAVPLAQRFSATWLGPFEVPWLAVLGVGGFGLLSALLAAVVPAVLASRQDVVAVLAGRRGEPAPSRRSPVLGAVLLLLGVAAAAYGTLTRGNELSIAVSAVLSVLGTVLLVPAVLALVGRLAGRLPLVARYAVRDAARQRTRTAPAVAAVAATVAGVVALGIGVSSDAREAQETYQPTLTDGAGIVSAGYTAAGETVVPDWELVADAVRRTLPDATLTPVQGVGAEGADLYTEVGVPGSRQPVLSSYGGNLGSSELVGAQALGALPRLSEADRRRAEAALDAGRLVVFSDVDVDAEQVRLRVERYDVVGDGSASDVVVRELLPATYLAVGRTTTAGAQLVLPPQVARDLGLPVTTAGLLVTGTEVSEDAAETVGEAVTALGAGGLYVERGYVTDDLTVIVLLVLGTLGGVLVLGGTLTATLLALADARPDLATLAAVGASPRARRGIAASYALVVGLVGAVLGAVVGLVPGLAAGVTLTSTESGTYVVSGDGAVTDDLVASGPYLDVPWLLVLAIVLALPLLSAALVAATTRSRLPLVARAA